MSEEQKKPIWVKLKEKWGVDSIWQVVIICVVFAITGSLSLKVGGPVLDFFQINSDTMNPWLYWTLRILIILPIYQVLLLLIGGLFGQWRFFYNMVKKTVGRLLPFLFSN